MNLLQKIPVIILLVSLNACTPAHKPESEATTKKIWQQQLRDLSQLQAWKINGRISVQTSDEGGQADFIWTQVNVTDYDIRLQAPLGAGTTWLKGDVSGVSLKTSSGDEMFDTDVDKLMQRLNGWPLPVKGLHYWVRGLPAEKTDYEISHWASNGLPEVMLQDGWRIEFRKYKQVADKMLPGKLFISRQGVDESEEIDVRMIIRQWNVL